MTSRCRGDYLDLVVDRPELPGMGMQVATLHPDTERRRTVTSNDDFIKSPATARKRLQSSIRMQTQYPNVPDFSAGGTSSEA